MASYDDSAFRQLIGDILYDGPNDMEDEESATTAEELLRTLNWHKLENLRNRIADGIIEKMAEMGRPNYSPEKAKRLADTAMGEFLIEIEAVIEP